MKDNQGEAQDLNYRIPVALAKRLVKVKGFKAVQEYLSLLKDVTDYKLGSGKVMDGADIMGLRAVGWMGANEVIKTLDIVIDVAKEVIIEYNENLAALESSRE